MWARVVKFECEDGEIDMYYNAAIKMKLVKDFFDDNPTINVMPLKSLNVVIMNKIKNHLYHSIDHLSHLPDDDVFGTQYITNKSQELRYNTLEKGVDILNACLFLGYSEFVDEAISWIATYINKTYV